MELFTINQGKVVPSTHALLIEPYKSMWAADTSEDKHEAINVFSYIEFLCSPKMSNPFHGIPQDIRPKEIKRNIWKDEQYQSDVYSTFEIIQGVETYKELLANAAPGYDLYLSALSAADTLKTFLNDLDLTKTTNSGALQLKPADVTKALNEIGETISNLTESRRKLLAEIKESNKTKGGREPGLFER